MKLKLIRVIFVLLLSPFFVEKVQAMPTEVQAKITMAVLAEVSRTDFDQKLSPILQKEFEKCANCAFLNITPYNEKGEFNFALVQEAIEGNLGKFQILFFNWNEKLGPQNKTLNDYLQKLSTQNILIVASAGQPKENESSGQLVKTLLGSIPKSIIIGEIGEKDRLIGQSYYGPEMLTALRPPKELLGQGFSPLIFAARMTKNFPRHQDWVSVLHEKKNKSKKVWLDMGDIF